MALKSVLKPDSAVMVGLAEAAAVYVIYNSALPSHADIRSAPPHDQTIESSRKAAAYKSAAVLGFIFLLTRDLNSFLIGGLALGGIDYMAKHSNGVNPATGKLADAAGSSITGVAVESNDTAFPMSDYSDSPQPDLSYSAGY
ncbi:MAG: hypothetical protein JWO67_2248 [Streptosporangiaceae bacterium]|nr:hypothetical protein [Streptosporangiaceae bacterium]